MKELEKGDQNSKSLLANVLDLEGDFILAPGGLPLPNSISGSMLCGMDTIGAGGGGGGSLPYSPTGPSGGGGNIGSQKVEKELHSILTEIKVITNKIRAQVKMDIIHNRQIYEKRKNWEAQPNVFFFSGTSQCN